MKRTSGRLKQLADEIERKLVRRLDSFNSEFSPATNDEANLTLVARGVEIFREIGECVDRIELLLREFTLQEELVKAANRAGIEWKFDATSKIFSLPFDKKVEKN